MSVGAGVRPLVLPRFGDNLVERAKAATAARSVPRVSVADIEDTRLRDSTRMLLVMTRLGKPIYQGTANQKAVARRHARNKVARAARRVHRG